MNTKAFVTASRAGTGRVYIVAQVAEYGPNQLHFQVNSPSFNRPYGMAFDTPSNETARRAIEQALEGAGARALSLAGTEREYAVVLLKPLPDRGVLHVQVPLNSGINRRYGAAFDVQAPAKALTELQALRSV